MKRFIGAALLLLPAVLVGQSLTPVPDDSTGAMELFARHATATQKLQPGPDAQLQPKADFAGFDYIFVISAAGNLQGARGTYFRSDIVLLNLRGTDQEVTLFFCPANQTNSLTRGLRGSVPKYGAVAVRDVIGNGAFNTTGFGAIIVMGTAAGNVDEGAKLAAFSRIWTPTPGGGGGTASQSFLALSPKDLAVNQLPSFMIGARQDGNFRANIGIFNFSDRTQSFLVSFDSIDTGRHSTINLTIPAYSLIQQSVPAEITGDFVATIGIVPGPLFRYNAYVSTTDNLSGDSWSANLVQYSSTDPGTGRVVFWTDTVEPLPIDITIDGTNIGTINGSYISPPDCNATSRVVSITRPPGTFTYVAVSQSKQTRWQDTVTVTAGGCQIVKLKYVSGSPPRVCGNLVGTWRRVAPTPHPKCVGMIVQFDGNVGRVTSSPSGCAFPIGDIKWKNLNVARCEVDDLGRSESTGSFGRYDPVKLHFYDQDTVYLDGPSGSLGYRRQ